jgi:hypothetical protein
MKKIAGSILTVLGGLLILLLLPFLIHTVMNVICVLLLGQPVPGWWWQFIGSLQNILALPIVAFAFVIKVGPAMSLIGPLIVILVIMAVGILLLRLGLRLVRKERRAKR